MLPPYITPLKDNMVIIGRAMTVLEFDYFAIQNNGKSTITNKPFGLMLEALDDLREDEVYIASGASHDYALWGEIMSYCALNNKAAGAILNGYSRDTDGILESGLPVFFLGKFAQDQGVRGKVIDFRVPLKINNVTINDGDLIFADKDGIVIIPKEVEKETITKAYEKALTENKVKDAIMGGMKATEAWDTFGVM